MTHYGHQEGDVALRSVAQTAKNVLRDADRVFRYGGEEMLILMPESHLQEAEIAAERVREAIYQLQIPHQPSPLGYLSVSIGLAETGSQAWLPTIKRADEALYRAKNSGRNRLAIDTSVHKT